MKRYPMIGVMFLLVAALVFRSDSQGRVVYSQSTGTTATVPLYRLHNFDTDQYVLTTDTNELAAFISQGWTYERIIGYLYTARPQSNGPRPFALYRLHNVQTGLYAVEYNPGLPEPQSAWVTMLLGYGYAPLAGTPPTGLLSVEFIGNDASQSEFFASDLSEMNNISGKAGWTSQTPGPRFDALDGTTLGNPGWPKQFGTYGDEGVTRILVDHSGSVYLIGFTDENLFEETAPSNHCFVAKYDTGGNLLWGKQFGSMATDTASSACVDSNNNLYIVGDTDGNLCGTNAGGTDAYVTKLSPNGDTLWSKQFGTSATDFGSDVAVDAQDNVYIGGETVGSLFTPNSGSHQDLGGAIDAYIVEYDANGNQSWSTQFGDGGISSVRRIRIDAASNIYLAGGTGSLFGPNVTGYDSYVAKYSPSKTLLWGRQFGSQNVGDVTETKGLCVDSTGNIYVGGETNEHDNIDGNPDTGDGYVTKFDGSGNRLWTQAWATAAEDDVLDLALDSQSNVYAVGDTAGSLFGTFAGGDDNAVMAKYDTNGTLVGSTQYGGYCSLISVAVDTQDRLYLAGGTYVSLFGPCAGGSDIFLQRLDANGQVASASRVAFPKMKPQIDALGVRLQLAQTITQKRVQCAWAGKVVKLNYPPVLVAGKPYMYIGYAGVATRGCHVLLGKGTDKKVSVVSRERQVSVSYGSSIFRLNGRTQKMAGKPVSVGGGCYVPLGVIQAAVPIPIKYSPRTRQISFIPPQLQMRLPRKLRTFNKRI